ncbi:hypothetical protein B0H10DRAFT_2219718 [Mycena sp. CBHHK59/15]|nr:hypothetical protein B0H10DRAFT_2219718 [Mycena sp. CBHHK59/15]
MHCRYIYSFDFLPGRSPASVVITTFETILLECVELVRSIDQDTTFKRLKAGLLNEYELTAFFTPLDRLFTFGRLYMDAKDADTFEFAWDKIHEAFFAATNKVLAFKAWSKDGWLGMNKFLEALHDHLFRLAGPDPTLSIESNPPQFSEPQDLNSGVTVESGAMESDGDPTPAGLVQVGTSLNATPPSSHALASVRVPLSPRRSSRKRAASTVHSDAPPSKIISAESSGVPVITADSGRRTRRKPKPWGVVHDNQTYTSLEFLVQFPDEYRSLYGDAEPA